MKYSEPLMDLGTHELARLECEYCGHTLEEICDKKPTFLNYTLPQMVCCKCGNSSYIEEERTNKWEE